MKVLENPKILRSYISITMSAFLVFAGSFFVYSAFVDDTEAEFDAGTYTGTDFDSGNGWVEIATTTNVWTLPDSESATGWTDMSSTSLLFHFEEGSGNATDSSGNSNTGTVSGDTTGSTTKKLGDGAYTFDGTGDYITVTSADELQFVDDFTIMAWVYPTDVSAGLRTVISRYDSATWPGDSTSLGYIIRMSGDNPEVFVANNAGASGTIAATNEFAANTWHHLVLRYDDQHLYFYVDGELVGDIDENWDISSKTINTTIGSNLAGGELFKGNIDEVAVFERPLTENEILEIYERQSPVVAGYYDSQVFDAGASTSWNTLSWSSQQPFYKELPDSLGVETGYAGGNIDMTNNVLLYHMNEASGNLTDASGQGNTGTASGNPVYGGSGMFNDSIAFDGTGDWFDAGTASELLFQDDFAVSVWARADQASTAGFQTIVSRYDTSWNGNNGKMGYIIRLDTGSLPRFYVAPATSGSAVGIVGTKVDTNWHHYALRYSDQHMYAYVDGVEIGNVDVNADIGAETTLTAIGSNFAGGEAFIGDIDEVAIWNTPLTATDMTNLYRRGQNRLKFQVRSCDDSSCSGETFAGSGGTSTSTYSELNNTGTSTPSLSVTSTLSDNRYFQYRIFFESATTTYSPELLSVAGVHANIAPTVTALAPSQFTANLVTVTTTIADLDSNVTSLIVEYSLDNSTWVSSTIGTATQAGGEGDGATTSTGNIADIDTDNDGSVDLTFTWNIVADIPNTEDTTVYLRVIPNDGTDNGTTQTSAAFAVDTSDPTVPSALTVDILASSTLNFTFPTTTSTDSNFSEYKIFYATTTPITVGDTAFASSTESDLGDSNFNGTTTSTDLTSLIPNSLYYFNIFAYDSWGNVTSSVSELSTTTLAAIPLSFATSTVATSSIGLTWGTNSNPSDTVYEIRLSDDTLVATTTATTYLVTGLSPNTQYVYKVRAYNSDNIYTLYATSILVYTLAVQSGTPTVASPATSTLAITIVDTSNSSSTTFAIYNTSDSVYIDASGAPNGSTPVYQTTSTWGGTVTATGLSINTAYQFQTVARNGDSVNAATSTVSTAVYTLANPAGMPTIGTPTDTTLPITIAVNSNPAATIYVVYNVTDATFLDASGVVTSTAVYSSTSTLGSSFAATGLSVNTPYTFTVIAKNGDDTLASTSTASASTYTLASVPSSLSVATVSATALTLSWSGDGTTYTAQNVTDSETSTGISGTSKAYTGLTCATAYTFQVKALNGDGVASTYSATISGTTSGCPTSSSGGGGFLPPSPPIFSTPSKKTPSTPHILSVPQGASSKVRFGSTVHTITVLNSSDSSARVKVESDPVIVDVPLNGVKDVDSDKDGFDDVRVAYLGKIAGVPKIVVLNLTDPDETSSPLTINAGRYDTTSSVVKLSFNVDNVSQIALSNSSDFGNATFVDFQKTKSWILSPGTGEKTVYAVLRTPGGGSAVVSDSITVVGENAEVTPTVLNNCLLRIGKSYKSVSSNAVYYIDQAHNQDGTVNASIPCAKREFTNSRIFFSYFSSWGDVLLTDNATLSLIQTDSLSFMPWGDRYDPKYGALVKVVTDPKVYLLLGAEKYWITNETVFTTLRYVWSWIEDISQGLLNKYSTGSEITEITRHPNYTLIKYDGSHEVYRLEPSIFDQSKTIKRYITNEKAFNSLGFRWDRIVTVSDVEVYMDGERLE